MNSRINIAMAPGHQFTGLEAAKLVRERFVSTGLSRLNWFKPVEVFGWGAGGDTSGFGLRSLPDGRLSWSLVVSGKEHLEYQAVEEQIDGQRYMTHEPVDPESLSDTIRSVFDYLHIEVHDVRCLSWETCVGDDIDFEVISSHPTWIERPPVPRRPEARPESRLHA